jgi:hypothetical protein
MKDKSIESLPLGGGGQEPGVQEMNQVKPNQRGIGCARIVDPGPSNPIRFSTQEAIAQFLALTVRQRFYAF